MSSLYNHLSSNHNTGSSGITTSSSANSTQGGSSGGFPLRNNFFRSLPLSKETIDSLYHSAKANATACLNQSFNDQWRYVPPEKDGTQLRKDTSNLSSSFRLVRAATVLRCQEHEVNMVISNTNTDSWREFMRKCFGKQYLDTMILHSLMNPVDKSPPVGMELPTPASPPSTSTSSIDNNRSHRDPSEHETGSDDEHGRRQTIYIGKSMDGEQESTTEGEREDESIADDASEQRLSDMTQREDTGVSSNGEDFDELLTVKWGAMDAGSIGKHDLCLVDYLSTGYLPNTDNQEKIHLWCFSSVEGERVGCMALKDTHNISRTTLTKLGVFWRKLNEDETEVIVCGSFPSKHAKYVSSILLQSLNRLQGIVEDLRLSNQIYVHRSKWVKDHERSSCHLCMRNFHTLRRKHHCRKCGEVICSDCSLVENVDLPVIGSSKLRLCKVCCVKAKSTPLKKQDKSNVFDHIVRARSLSNISVHSPYGSRMSFMDTGGSTGSLVGKSSSCMGGTNNKSRSEQMIEASSSSMSSDNNSNEVYEVMEEYDSKPTFTTIAQEDDFDDFIDTRCLNRQLSALEMNQNVKNDAHGSNSNMFDLLCELACQTLNCPIASVSVIDSQGDTIRSSAGLNDSPSVGEELAVFIDKIMGSTAAIVLDSNVDKQVQALFTRRIPSIRFFAGCPVFSRSGKKLGFVCVADVTKRDTLGSSCAFTMERLATLAITTMERSMSSKQQNEPVSYSSNNQTSHQYQQQNYPTNPRSHPATIFDRPNVPRSRRKDGHFSDSGGGYPQPMQARVYDVSDPELGGGSSIPSPVAPPPRGYSGEYSTGYYEAQERMRKLLLKSYHTQQQLASGGGAMPLPPE